MSQKIDLLNHIGGNKTALSPFFYKPGETPKAVNTDMHQELGAVSKSIQYDQFHDSPGNGPIQGIVPANAPDGSAALFLVSGGTIYRDRPGSWTNLGTNAFDTVANVSGAFMYDTLFLTDGIRAKYSTNMGLSFSTSSLAIAPKLFEPFKNRLYAANFGANEANRFRFSDLGDGNTFSDVNYIDTIDAPITAMKATLNYLYLFTADSVWRWDETYLFKVDNLGTRSPSGAVYGAQMIFMIGVDGIFQISGNHAPYQISRPIQEWLSAIDPVNYPKFNTAFSQDEVFFWIGDVLGYTDVVLVYNTIFKNWRVLDNWPSGVMAVWTDSTNSKTLYFGHRTSNKVYAFGGTVDQNDVATAATYDYPVLIPAGGDKEFQGISLHCFAKAPGLATFEIQYALDWSDQFVTLTQWELRGLGYTEHIHIDVPNSLNGRAVQWRIKESASGIPWTWEGMRFYFELLKGVND